jgi:anti-anti-sigma factor
VVIVLGDADLTVADELESALEEACADAPQVVVDLAAATLLDSRVIGVLQACAERLRQINGGLTITGANADVRRLFTTIGLDREFRFLPPPDSAPPDG